MDPLLLLKKCRAVDWLKLDHGVVWFYRAARLSLPRMNESDDCRSPMSSPEFRIEAPLLEHLTVTTQEFDVFCDFPNLRTIATSNYDIFDHLRQKQTIVAIRVLAPDGWFSMFDGVMPQLPNLRLLQV